MDVDVVREAHGFEHLGAEHPAVADLDPLVEQRVEREDLKGRLKTSYSNIDASI